MKACLCCAASAIDTAITCAACGEGSWYVATCETPEADPAPVVNVARAIDVPPEPFEPPVAEPIAEAMPVTEKPEPVAAPAPAPPVHLSRAERRKHWR